MTATTPKHLNAPWVPKMMKYAGRAQVWVFRRTGGRIGSKWRIGAGFRNPVPTLLLDHRGRKSGATYTAPLLYITDGPDTIVVASQGGLDKHPQWYHNLRAHPDTHIQIGRRRRPVHAIVANRQERERLWALLLEAYADFATYQTWTDREIPVIILRPS
ncbi:nitroreductase family deazaflavin-dependent oxidoreductase [Nocardia alni]|uniref:nitroreductase family deazaflavin-dependent oxidoreductase n=1 Tax=Nocardia alni TaxID=2815723 RepID=UPI001C2512B1|nr:nitroreductase family deazaflavin-dependent oxidoreductase [Nocardia alni]